MGTPGGREAQRGFSQLVTNTLSADAGIDNHGSQQRTIRIQFYRGGANDVTPLPGHDHCVDVPIYTGERKMLGVEQSVDGG